MTPEGTPQNRPSTQKVRLNKAEPGNWLSGNMAQIMVLMNGLIVTITAYAILNVFITEIVHDSLKAESKMARDYVKERIDVLEQDVQAAASLIAFSAEAGEKMEVVRKFHEHLNHSKGVEQLFWLSREEAGPYRVMRMMASEEAQRTEASPSLTELHKTVIRALGNVPEDSLVMFGRSEDGMPLIVSREILRPRQKDHDVVYALAHFEKIFPFQYFEKNANIGKFELVDADTSETIYAYNRGDYNGTDVSRAVLSAQELVVGQARMKVLVHLLMDSREQFLQKVPLLMLMFGITLTLIGTLYVRNNQRQSIRLAAMNKELAGKNADLNAQVSEREKLNLALQKAERENRAIVNSVSDIIFETATDGKILFLNKSWEKITGFSLEQSLARSLFDLLYMQDQVQQKADFEQFVKGQKQSYRAFTRIRTSGGTFRAVELSISMLRKDDSDNLRVVGAITDVEERRRAERALSEAERKYRAIVDNAASGIYQSTPDGQYLSANPAMARILGLNLPEDVLQKVHNANVDVYASPLEREKFLSEVLRRDGGWSGEIQMRRYDGVEIWVQENLRAVRDEAGALIYFEGGVEDITARKAAEIALREAKVASDLANRAKSEFLANMSHELRTPLNAIIGFSDIIRNQAFGTVGSPEYLEYARDINEGGKRLLQIINDILDVSRVEAGERPLNEGMVDLFKITQSAAEIVAPKIEAAQVTLTNLVGDDAPRLVGEVHAIKQMLINLLSNSAKYTPAGGRIMLSYELDDEGQMRLSVTDTGIGLTDEEIGKALSPFGQVETSLSKNETGTGLGLTLVQSLMGLHGGTFEMFSQKGVGTTATLIFPPKRVTQPRRANETA